MKRLEMSSARLRAEPVGPGVGGFGLQLVEARTPERTQRRQRDLADLAARLMIGTLVTLMAIRIGADFLATGRLTGLLLLASETLVVVFTVFRRAP